jgi:adhesin HecA-like repeat protein
LFSWLGSSYFILIFFGSVCRFTLEHYNFQTDPQHPYLLEAAASTPLTSSHLSSDYLLQEKLQLTTLPKRLSLGMQEQHQVIQQLYTLTHPADPPDPSTWEATFKALMEAAYTQHKALGLQVGTPLTPEQIQQLQHNILWMIHHEVTLPDGQRHNVLIPQVYLAPITPIGAVIAAKRIHFKAQAIHHANSSLLSQEDLYLAADTITNEGNIHSQGELQLKAKADLDSTGELIAPQVTLEVGKTLHIHSETQTHDTDKEKKTTLDAPARLQANYLSIHADHINFQAVQCTVADGAYLEAAEEIHMGGVPVARSLQETDKTGQLQQTEQKTIG